MPRKQGYIIAVGYHGLYCISRIAKSISFFKSHSAMFSISHSPLCYILSFCILLSPVFGALVKFAADLTWELGAPVGQQRYVIHTNGQFPGPPLLLKQGDSVEVREQCAPASLSLLTCLQFTVVSHLPFLTTIHFHGIEYEH